ncbi:MAG: crossover junction endodeoxyribonuclease RuvC [Candidatus Dormibacteraeota bacterium]|nr:crossover junction endodeoxyribonuclease RuvC [Candidatus Dormibacteraeota bacterium]
MGDTAGMHAHPADLILGIDPGLAQTGYALLREPADVLACGTIQTPAGARSGLRLLQIQQELEGVLDRFRVREAALEELFMGSNRTSVIGVAQARGVVLALLEGRGIPTQEYKPASVKLVVSGYGNASKAQMARMLAAQLRSLPPGSNHALDAVAIAICHARSRLLRIAAAR